MIDTIIFDLGNVLIDFCWEKCFRKTLGLSGDTFERLANATTRNETWNRNDKGDLSDEEILAEFISNDPGIEKEIRALWDNISDVLEPFDYAGAWIRDLKKRGFKVYILSNFSRKAYTEGADKLKFVKEADGALISYEEKLIKPDPAIYELLLKRYDITPENAVFFDDREDNVEAAIKCGINGVVFTSKDKAEEYIAGKS